VARAIVRQPSVFLFDEPLSNLDAKLRVQMRAEITKLQRRLETTCVYVTHDQIEAMTMGHRIAVMNAGKIQQVGTPLEVYDRPANLFVANFIGTPPMNFVKGTIREGGAVIGAEKFSIAIPEKLIPITRPHDGSPVVVGIRPENILSADKEAHGPTSKITGEVEMVEPLGHEVIVHVRVGDDLLVASLESHHLPRVGDPLDLVIETEAMHLFDARSELRME
jgi:multiple sugar transport system ATP-binding protein